MKDKRAMFNVGLYLISLADEGVQTVKLKEAVKELENMIHARENLPF